MPAGRQPVAQGLCRADGSVAGDRRKSRRQPLQGAAHADTPLISREQETDLMLQRWEQAKAGNGRVLLISGEPGIGKSRLVEALVSRLNMCSISGYVAVLRAEPPGQPALSRYRAV